MNFSDLAFVKTESRDLRIKKTLKENCSGLRDLEIMLKLGVSQPVDILSFYRFDFHFFILFFLLCLECSRVYHCVFIAANVSRWILDDQVRLPFLFKFFNDILDLGLV